MESMRRSLDRSREPGLKKPRLAEDQSNPSGGRPFVQRQPPAPARYRSAAGGDRDSEGNDRGGGAYHPQPVQQCSELVNQYKTAIAELTFNSKPIITNLTIIAGENVLTAKAISATVCNNIIEVPSDQKLPSLYLLDSIVKNIGRDYIKYFAARLPEVFCKAYSQVDPPIQSSMRHLFGTWKGVFPLQTLKMIEKELGFSSAVNGSSSSSVTSRADALSQRPQHSIHVNPKYLERQRLQQSGRAPIADSPEDIESPERTSGIVGSSPWTNSAVKIHRSQITPQSDPIEEKNIGPLYGDLDYGTDSPRNSILGSGRLGARAAEQSQPKPWYGASSGVSQKLTDPRKAFRMKHGVPEHLIPKSTKAVHLQPTDSIARKRGNSISTSWKNSEEEEFMWDMHSRLPDQDVTTISDISRKDTWTPSDPQNLGFENRVRRPQLGHDVGFQFDTESSSDSLSTEQRELGNRLSSPWGLQESTSMDELMFSSSNTNPSYADGNLTTHGGLPSRTSSVSRIVAGPSSGSSHARASGLGVISNVAFIPTNGAIGQKRLSSIGTSSPSQQSLLHQASPSSSFPSHYPPSRQLPSATEHDYSQILPPSHQKVHQFSTNLSPQSVQLGNVNRFQSEELSVPSGSLQKQNPPLEWNTGAPSTSGSSESDQSIQRTTETSGQQSTSSLLAAVMKSGILANITAAGVAKKSLQSSGQIVSKPVTKPPLPNVTPPAQVVSALPMSTSSKSGSSSVSHKKDKQQQLPQGAPPLMQTSKVGDKVSNPISNLLSSLLVKGLIKSETSPSATSQMNTVEPESQKKSTIAPKPAPVSSVSESAPTADEESLKKTDAKSPIDLPVKPTPVIPKAKDNVSLLWSISVETESLIGLKFKSDVIRDFHPAVIDSLFSDLPHQCDVCGLRLKQKEGFDKHLEWHSETKIGPDDKRKRWYAQIGHWISPNASVPSEAVDSSPEDGPDCEMVDRDDDLMALADEDQCVCVLCGELFEDYYSPAGNRWMFRGAVHMTPVPPGNDEQGNGPLVHVHCRSEGSASELGLLNSVKMVSLRCVFYRYSLLLLGGNIGSEIPVLGSYISME
ncbi:unnamed protein product [Linum trigynum]|uniref:CID domain-containing protein n=1 Tax=Linum trigynum TaxID=586398 RepID=A0AAV2FK17_9ROSI